MGEWTRKGGDSSEDIRFTPQGTFERRTHFPSFVLVTTGAYSLSGKHLSIAIKTATPDNAEKQHIAIGLESMIGKRLTGDIEMKGDSEFTFNTGKETLVFDRKP